MTGPRPPARADRHGGGEARLVPRIAQSVLPKN